MALLFLLISSPLHQTKAATAKAPLGVQPLQAATQRDKSVSYFDLLLGAGQTETMQVKLTNNTNKAITVAVKPTTATSADSGIIDYTGGSNTPDKTMAVKIASLIQGGDSITVPANASATYAAKLTMPTQAIAGVMAGGLVFTPTGQTSTATSGKMGIVNKYSYTVAVLARNNATILTPKLAIGTIKAERTKYVNRISVVLRNETAAFANQVRAVTTIKKPNGKTSTLTQKSAQLAPNSLMHQSLVLGDNVAAGDYQVHTVVYWGKADNGKYAVAGAYYQYRTQTSKTVTITAAQARAFSRQAKATKGGMPTIYKILITIGIVIVVLLLLLLLLLARHRKQRKAQVAALEAQVKALKDNQK